MCYNTQNEHYFKMNTILFISIYLYMYTYYYIFLCYHNAVDMFYNVNTHYNVLYTK